MQVIAHRGNLTGPNPERENKLDYIAEALAEGVDVEVDVWFHEGKLYLGHDKPDTPISVGFLLDNRFWCHAKNIEALDVMLDHNVHCFFHDVDEVTLTSKGFVWTFPGKKLTKRSVCVLPETTTGFYGQKFSAICTDYTRFYKFADFPNVSNLPVPTA